MGNQKFLQDDGRLDVGLQIREIQLAQFNDICTVGCVINALIE